MSTGDFVKKKRRQQELKHDSLKRIAGYVPRFKNMYRCAEHTEWVYAESEYQYATG